MSKTCKHCNAPIADTHILMCVTCLAKSHRAMDASRVDQGAASGGEKSSAQVIDELRARIAELEQAYQDAKHEADEHLETIVVLEAENKRLVAERDCLHNAILWALGCNGDFPQRQDGQGAYWWRHELRRRCGVKIGPPRAANDARAGKEDVHE